MKYVANRQLFVVMTGDRGTGKTTTLRRCFRRGALGLAETACLLDCHKILEILSW